MNSLVLGVVLLDFLLVYLVGSTRFCIPGRAVKKAFWWCPFFLLSASFGLTFSTGAGFPYRNPMFSLNVLFLTLWERRKRRSGIALLESLSSSANNRAHHISAMVIAPARHSIVSKNPLVLGVVRLDLLLVYAYQYLVPIFPAMYSSPPSSSGRNCITPLESLSPSANNTPKSDPIGCIIFPVSY